MAPGVVFIAQVAGCYWLCQRLLAKSRRRYLLGPLDTSSVNGHRLEKACLAEFFKGLFLFFIVLPIGILVLLIVMAALGAAFN